MARWRHLLLSDSLTDTIYTPEYFVTHIFPCSLHKQSVSANAAMPSVASVVSSKWLLASVVVLVISLSYVAQLGRLDDPSMLNKVSRHGR